MSPHLQVLYSPPDSEAGSQPPAQPCTTEQNARPGSNSAVPCDPVQPSAEGPKIVRERRNFQGEGERGREGGREGE